MNPSSITDFSPASISADELNKIQALEQQLSKELNKPIVVLAYENRQ